MALRFEPVMLGSSEDDVARLVFCDERLVAIMSQLSDLHEEFAGQWFVEMAFGEEPVPGNRRFQTWQDVECWLARDH